MRQIAEPPSAPAPSVARPVVPTTIRVAIGPRRVRIVLAAVILGLLLLNALSLIIASAVGPQNIGSPALVIGH